jgi:glucose/arabinose dehydrogenase
MSIAAQGFNHTRFMAMSPDHRLFVGEMTSASDTNTGRVLVFDGFDPSTGKFAASHIYLSNLRNPNSVSFYTDHQGQSWIYIALTDKLIRYRYSAGDNAPQSEGEVLAHFPDYGKPVSEGGWHLTRTLAWNDDQLFVSVGSSCNSCEETEPIRGVILTMNPDGSNSRVYASGLRNAVGITYAAGALFATANEADHLGNDRPDDVVYKIIDGTNYGWPYCYQFGDAVYADASQTWQQPFDCSKVPLAWAVLPPHSAPLGITFFDASFSDPALQNAFLVAMHGSGKPALATGYQVALVRTGSAPIPFIDGFLQNDTRVGRPVAILQNDANSFFVSDDLNGAIYYLHYDR